MMIIRRDAINALGVKEGNVLCNYLNNIGAPKVNKLSDRSMHYCTWVNHYDTDILLKLLDTNSKFGGAKRNLTRLKKVIEYVESCNLQRENRDTCK